VLRVKALEPGNIPVDLPRHPLLPPELPVPHVRGLVDLRHQRRVAFTLSVDEEAEIVLPPRGVPR